jgi:transcription elongation factor Elf1
MCTEIRNCKLHGQTDFVKRKDGYFRCKKCSVNAVIKRRLVLKQKAVEYKGGACERCGYNKSNRALDFHHVDPSQKDFGIGYRGYTRSWEKVKKELDKCILVCSNCHAEIHEEIDNNNKSQ